jgi:ribosomal protein S18 acetylase RimI-like enzyme
MATEDPAFIPIDIHHPETAKAFIAFLEPLLPFSCSLIGLTQGHLTPQPDPYLKVWATFDFSSYRTTSEVPELFAIAVFTPNQGRLFCSADASPEDVTPEELVYREKVTKLYAVTATSLVRTLPGHEEDSEYLLGVVHEKFAPLVRPYARGGPIAPCRLFFHPPSNTKVIDAIATSPGARWLVTSLEESDLELVQSTSQVQRTIEYLRTRIPVSTCIRDPDSADGKRPAAWLMKQSDGSLGALYVDPAYRGKGLGGLAVRECMKRLNEKSGNCGPASRWNFVEVFQENSLGIGFFGRLEGWEIGWETWWVKLDVAKYSAARV